MKRDMDLIRLFLPETECEHVSDLKSSTLVAPTWRCVVCSSCQV
jgi:hypothetical protein